MRQMVEKRRGSWGVGLLGRRKNRDSVSFTGPYSTRSLARIAHAHLNMMLCEMGRHRLTHQRVSSSEIHATLHSNSLSPSTLSTLLNLSQPASCAHRLVSPWGVPRYDSTPDPKARQIPTWPTMPHATSQPTHSTALYHSSFLLYPASCLISLLSPPFPLTFLA